MKFINRIIRNFKHILKKILLFFFYLMPIKKHKIIFSNFFGNGYGCNPKYICDELLKRKCNFKIIWVYSDEKQKSYYPKCVKLVKYKSLIFYFELITSKFWVFNIRNLVDVKKRKKQVYIQTWHGEISYKPIEMEIVDYLSEQYIKQVKEDSLNTSVIITGSEFFTEKVKKYFWYDGTIKKLGNARLDAMFNPHIKETIKRKFNVFTHQKIVLYCPTFRKDNSIFINEELISLFKDEFKKKFDCDIVVMVRLHPNDLKNSNLINSYNIINVTTYPDIQELLATADFFVTDYSSCIFEFALQKKPAFIYAPDFEEYQKSDRKLNSLIYSSPFGLAKNLDELRENINKFDLAEYVVKIDKLIDEYEIVFDGNSSKRIVDYIMEKV